MEPREQKAAPSRQEWGCISGTCPMKGDYGPDGSSLSHLAFWPLSEGDLRSVLDCRPKRFRQELLMASSALGCMATDDWERLHVAITPMWSPGLQSETELPGEGLFPPRARGSYTTQPQQAKGESSVCAWSGVGYCRFSEIVLLVLLCVSWTGLSSQLCCKLFKSKLIFLYLFLASGIGRCDYLLSNE